MFQELIRLFSKNKIHFSQITHSATSYNLELPLTRRTLEYCIYSHFVLYPYFSSRRRVWIVALGVENKGKRERWRE